MAILTADDNLTPRGNVTTTSGFDTAKGLADLTGGIPDGAQVALIQALTQNVRWKDDGGTPTAADGTQLAAGKDFFYNGNLATIEFIEEAASAELNVSYYSSRPAP